METHHLSVSRTARYYTIGQASAAVTDVWIVCHGYGQLAAAFVAPFERIAAESRLIIAPEGLSRFYLDRSRLANDPAPRVGATWMTREDRDHEISDHVAYLDALHDLLRPPERVAGTSLRVLGFSQGVATVGRWLAHGRTRADEVILWAGAFPPDVELGPLAQRLDGARVILVAGSHDELASWAAADAQLERFVAAGIDARLIRFDGGHRLDDATLDALAAAIPR
jgi:predicted esterase